jgi:hypothetical protein
MKLQRLFLTLLALTATASADPLTVTGVDDNGSAGVYEIGGQNYWWLCIEPVTPRNVLPAETISVDAISVLEGWDQQNQERLDFYTLNSGYYTTAIPRQVAVMEYVLDTYLPWNTLAGVSGRFAEQDSNASGYANDDAFYNPLFAVQNFLAETYGKAVKEDFTDMSDFVDYYLGDPSVAGIARSGIFQDILDDVSSRGGAFFDTYTAQHGYLIANTLQPEADSANYQDSLIIFSFAPVPEPGGALLVAGVGFALLLRRRRLLN